MAVTFAIRGTQREAWYSTAGRKWGSYKDQGVLDPAVESFADVSVFGGKAINLYTAAKVRGLVYPGFSNWPNTLAFSVRLRLVPLFTGSPPNSALVFAATDPVGRSNAGIFWELVNDGTVEIIAKSNSGTTLVNKVTTQTISWTNGVAKDIMFAWDGTNGTNKCRLSVEGTLLTEWTGGNYADYDAFRANMQIVALHAGYEATASGVVQFALNEATVWDSFENVEYTPRTGFLSIPESDGLTNIPALSYAKQGTNFIEETLYAPTEDGFAAFQTDFASNFGATGVVDVNVKKLTVKR